MKAGKHTCEVLKSIRKQIADSNGIAYTPSECMGTSPNCERERQYLERELSSKLKAGKALKIVGIAAGLSAMVACQEAKGEEPAVENTVTQQKFQWDIYKISTGLPREEEAQWDEMADFVSEFPNDTFLVVGHTECRGSDKYNLKLSQRKAEFVRRALIDRGVSPDRILSVGCGFEEPVIPDAQSDEDHAQNRRATLEFYTPERMEEIVNETRTIDLEKK